LYIITFGYSAIEKETESRVGTKNQKKFLFYVR